MEDRALAVVLTLSRKDKLDRLALLCPSDAAAIELIIDDCLERRWPSPRTWLVTLREPRKGVQ